MNLLGIIRKRWTEAKFKKKKKKSSIENVYRTITWEGDQLSWAYL